MTQAQISQAGALETAETSDTSISRVPDLSEDEIEALLEAYSDHPSAGLVWNEGTHFFTNAARRGFLAYRERRRHLLQFGGTVGPPAEAADLLRDFLAFAESRNLRVIGIQIPERQVDLFHRHGFRLNQFGLSYSLDLAQFTLRGSRSMKLRNKIRQPQKHGIKIVELGREVAYDSAAADALTEISKAWLRTKGRHAKLLRFLVGEIGSIRRHGTRCFAALRGEELLAFISYAPAYGRYAGYTHDLTRRRPHCPPGTMEFINATAIARLQEEGVRFLNFGLTPFVGVHDHLGSGSPLLTRFIQLLARHGSAIYPARSQVDYKLKWAPQHVEPEYLVYRGRFRFSDVWALLRATNSI